jgi:O-antigen ligase
VISLAGSVVVAERYGNGVPADADIDRASAALTERRIELWRDAGRLAVDHPVTGVGPGRFEEASRIAGLDPDTRAAHSAILETAAEIGIPGAALLVGAMLAVLGGLWSRGRAAAPAMVAVAAWAAFCLHASVDYVGDFPAVVTTAGLVAGLGTAGTRLKAPNG